jgi:hypothetical protein
MVAGQLDDIRRQADLVAYDYERMMREAKAANTDLDAAHVIAEHLALSLQTSWHFADGVNRVLTISC